MPSNRPSQETMRAWRQFLEAHARVTRLLDAELRAAHGLPLEWYDVLVQLHEAGGDRTMGDLARALLISPSNCTRLVARMIDAGLVDRHHDPDDRRVVHATLTPAGRALLGRSATTHLRGIQRHVGRHLAGRESELVDVFAALGTDDQ